MQTKYCNSCSTEKPIEEFTKSKRQFKYTASEAYHAYCKVCNATRAREWRKKHPNYRGTGKLKSYPKEDQLLMSAIRQRLVDARSRCKKLNKPAPTIDADYLYQLFLQQNRKCAITGAELAVETNHSLCLSLDQIDPLKGYTKGNVQWLAWCVNRAKGDLTISDFYDMCEVVLEHRKVQRLSLTGVEPSGSKRGTPAIQDEDIVCST